MGFHLLIGYLSISPAYFCIALKVTWYKASKYEAGGFKTIAPLVQSPLLSFWKRVLNSLNTGVNRMNPVVNWKLKRFHAIFMLICRRRKMWIWKIWKQRLGNTWEHRSTQKCVGSSTAHDNCGFTSYLAPKFPQNFSNLFLHDNF